MCTDLRGLSWRMRAFAGVLCCFVLNAVIGEGRKWWISATLNGWYDRD
jgi:hypothetical protein